VARINTDFGEAYLGDAVLTMCVSDVEPVAVFFPMHQDPIWTAIE